MYLRLVYTVHFLISLPHRYMNRFAQQDYKNQAYYSMHVYMPLATCSGCGYKIFLPCVYAAIVLLTPTNRSRDIKLTSRMVSMILLYIVKIELQLLLLQQQQNHAFFLVHPCLNAPEYKHTMVSPQSLLRIHAHAQLLISLSWLYPGFASLM